MYRIRLLLFIAISWLFVVINIEEILASTTLSFLNISPVAYSLVILIFIAFLVLPHTSKVSYSVISPMIVFASAIITNLFALANPSSSLTLFNVLLELGVFSISTTIAYHLGQWFYNHNTDIKDAVFHSTETLVDTMFSDVEKIERKISRARRFENELTLISINLSSKLSNGTDKHQLSAYLAEALQIMENKGIINAWHNHTLLVCVPASAQSNQARDLIRNLSYVVQNVLDADNELQVTSFPNDGLVLNDLLDNNHSVSRHHQQSIEPLKSSSFYTIKARLQTGN